MNLPIIKFIGGPHRGINPPQALVHIPIKKGMFDMHIAVSSPNAPAINPIYCLSPPNRSNKGESISFSIDDPSTQQ